MSDTEYPLGEWVEKQLQENGWKLEDYPLNKWGEHVILLVRAATTQHAASHEAIKPPA